MPTVSRFLVKSSLAYLMIGLLWGLAIAWWGPNWPHAVTASQYHLLTVGWLTQMVFGVAYWLFPLDASRRRGNESTLWLSYSCLNVGLILRACFEPLNAFGRLSQLAFLLPLSALLQFLAAAAFIGIMWPRIVGPLKKP